MTGAKKIVMCMAAIVAIGASGAMFVVSPAAAQPSPPSPPGAPRLVADAIYYNGLIVTLDDAAPEAQAVALAGTKIVAVGSNDIVMTHRGSSTKVTLRAYTIDAAWQYGLDGSLGSVTPGNAADLAILSDNPLRYENNADGLLAIKVLATISQGRYFDHAGAPAPARGTAPQ